MIIKGKSDKKAFQVEINDDLLLAFLANAMEQASREYDPELATSPGGFPTALFTCILPHTAREAVGWDIETEGWQDEKAYRAFAHRLERKAGGGFSLESRQATWDKKAAGLTAAGLRPEDFIGKRPEAK